MPDFDVRSCVSILISADFLKISTLVDDSLLYISRNLNEILKLPLDMNCINDHLTCKLASLLSIDQIEQLTDRKDKFQSWLFMKKTD